MQDQNKTTADVIRIAFTRVQQGKLIGREQLRVLGGRFPAAQLPEYIELWKDALARHLPSRIYERVSRLQVEREASAPPSDCDSLERARCFGLSGDLDLRRDGAMIHWHLTGEAAVQWPDVVAAGFKAHDYWHVHPADFCLRELEAQTVQWRPNDDRVGGEWLRYGGLVADPQKEHDKILLRQLHYLRAGRQELVRFTKLVKGDFEQ